MSWSTIRRASENDTTRLTAAAERFCARHDIDYHDCTAEFAIDCALDIGGSPSYEHLNRARRLAPLWRRIIRRTLGNGAEGIAYGYVGFHIR
jgi:hypothetical protein